MIQFPRTVLPRLGLILFVMFAGVSGFSQTNGPVSKASIEKKIKALKENGNTAEEGVLSTYEEILPVVESREQYQARVNDFTSKLELIDSNLKSLRDDLAGQVASAVPLPNNLPDSEKELKSVSSSLEDASRLIKALSDTEAANRLRAQALPDEIQKLRDTIAAIPTPQILADDVTESIRSKKELEKARLELLQAQLKVLELEQDYVEKSPSLLLAQKNLAAKKLENLTKARTAMSDHVAKLRTIDARSAVDQARESLEKASTGSEALKDLAEKNVELANRKVGPTGISQRLSDATVALSLSEAELRKVNVRVTTAASRTRILEEEGLPLDPETGYLLRQQRGEMPSASQLKADIAKLLRDVTTAHLDQLKLEEEQQVFLIQKNRILNEALGPLPPEAEKKEAEKLLDSRAILFEELISDQRDYAKALDERLKTLRATRASVLQHQNFVDERLLWIRSSPFYGVDAMKSDLTGIRDITIGNSARSWQRAVAIDISGAPFLWIFFLLLWFTWLFFTKRINTHILYLNKVARDRTCTKFYPTVVATLLLLLHAAWIPMALFFLAWRFRGVDPALQSGLFTVSIFILLFEGLRLISKPDGFLKSHLGVAKGSCDIVHLNTTWFLAIFPILIFPAAILLEQDQLAESGRGFFTLATICMSIYMHRLFYPENHLLSLKENREWFAYPVYLVAVLSPALLALGALLGFFHSVAVLRQKIDATIWIVALSAFGVGLFLRWVLVSRRHAAINEALNKRIAMTEGDDPHDRSLEEIKADAAGLVNLQLKTRQLARLIVVTIAAIALWSVWSSTLPALNMLDRFELWNSKPSIAAPNSTTSANIPFLPTGQIDSPAPEATTANVESKGRVSLQNLLFSVFVLFLTFVGARNIPAFIDLLFLRRYYTKRGGAFAITTTLRYLIIAVGVTIALSHIGIEWSKIQWIAAAITLGVGFGLQEIFANFVAGLIILFERPIRLGDYVTLEDLSGHVTEIRIRATTIIDFSNKELVVPNKEFITGRLVNWTLTDPMFRVEIPVGIAYGSDTQKAKEILERLGAANPITLPTPKPQAVFMSFGESCLDFELRVHIKGAEKLVGVRSQLLFEIDREFRDANIEIAFPQRDIHIRSIESGGPTPPLPGLPESTS